MLHLLSDSEMLGGSLGSPLCCPVCGAELPEAGFCPPVWFIGTVGAS